MASYSYKNYKIVDADQLNADLTSVADAIREKGGTSDILNFPDGFVSAVEAIEAGGSVSVSEKDVNFYDYDGTLLHSYTVAEAQELAELPALPEREGLICQGWNWSLEDIKAHNRAVDVGATYITDNGATRIYISLDEGRTSLVVGLTFEFASAGSATVDWGDGTEPTTVSGNNKQYTPSHEYGAPGEYVVQIFKNGTGSMRLGSSETYKQTLVQYSSGSDSANYAYRYIVKKIEVGDVTAIGDYAFNGLSAESITIPNDSGANTYTFGGCPLNAIILPKGMTTVPKYVCQNSTARVVSVPASVTSFGQSACYSTKIRDITIPDGVVEISQNCFDSCAYLRNVIFPSSVKNIGSSAFANARSLLKLDFTRLTAVPTLGSSNSFGGVSSSGIPSDCKILVPAALYDEWIAATNWATYASKIVAV